MPRIEVEISAAVWDELQRRRGSDDDISTIVDRALVEAFELGRHTIFQVSTASALAQGVFEGAVTVATLEEHGDFGLGTFDRLNGELILFEGQCYRATYGGVVTQVDPAVEVPFAVVTRFSADTMVHLDDVGSIGALERELDKTRASENLFLAIRGDARFDTLTMRAACPAAPGEGLLEATRHQSEFEFEHVTGTIVGFWTPEYVSQVSISGYHFHFISEDRTLGGHVLGLATTQMEVGMQIETSIRLAIPNTSEFRAADLSGDHREAIAKAETRRQGTI